MTWAECGRIVRGHDQTHVGRHELKHIGDQHTGGGGILCVAIQNQTRGNKKIDFLASMEQLVGWLGTVEVL